MAARTFDRHRTLQQLKGVDWGEPGDAPRFVAECHRLRRKPLAEFTPEDLRVMVGQGVGLTYLMPLALEVLEENALAEGGNYPGDLLTSVSRVVDSFWTEHPDWHRRACGDLEAAKALMPTLETFNRRTVERMLKNASPAFQHLRS